VSSPTKLEEHPVVSREEWIKAATDFLAKEKELTELSDELARRRRALPWTRVTEDYVFDGPNGPVSLADLFAGRSQLAVYHFMFGPDWNEGCPSCSFVTDHLDGMLEHLRARDVSLVLISRGPPAKLAEFGRRLGWRIPWVSSGGNTFNRDFAVSFPKNEVEGAAHIYNLDTMPPYGEENPGFSFFFKDAAGAIYRTYSTYARGVEAMMSTYALLDRVAKGRDEAGPNHMSWVRYHDRYEPTVVGIDGHAIAPSSGKK